MNRILLWVIGAAMLSFQITMFIGGGFGGGMAWLIMQLVVMSIPVLMLRNRRIDKQIETERELVRRADYEHAALLRGDVRTGTYGRYQPTKL